MAQSKKQKKAAAQARAKQRARNLQKGPTSGTRKALEDQVSNLQSALFNMRQMYDAVSQEKAAVEAQLVQRDQIITGLAIEYQGVSVKRSTMVEVGSGDYLGYEQEMEGDEMFIFAIHKDDLEEETDVEPDATGEVGEEDEE